MSKKIAVVLSGCGNKDGSEIHEAVSLIVNLSKWNAQVEYFAPDQNFEAQNFITGERLSPARNVMVESARISRGNIHPLSQLRVGSFDAIALPGGYGAALNLSNWAAKGAQCQVHPDLEKALLRFHSESKPIAAICIAPTLVAKVLGNKGVTLTVGSDRETIAEILKTGARHEVCPVTDFVTDREHKVITTPAYMYDAKPHEVFAGISGLSKELVEMC